MLDLVHRIQNDCFMIVKKPYSECNYFPKLNEIDIRKQEC